MPPDTCGLLRISCKHERQEHLFLVSSYYINIKIGRKAVVFNEKTGYKKRF